MSDATENDILDEKWTKNARKNTKISISATFLEFPRDVGKRQIPGNCQIPVALATIHAGADFCR